MILWIALAYLAIGLLVALVGPGARVIEDEFRKAPADEPIKAQALRAILVVVMAALWPVVLPSAIRSRRRKKREEEGRANSLVGLLDAMAADGIDADVIPGATGEFGLTATNPIPTRTPMGSESYLRRLRTASGAPVTWSRRGSTVADGIQKPVDIYEIRDPRGDWLATLFVSPYHKRNSRLAPSGFGFGFESAPDKPDPAPALPGQEGVVAITDEPSADDESSPVPLAEPTGSKESANSARSLVAAREAEKTFEAVQDIKLGPGRLHGANGSPKHAEAAEYNLNRTTDLGSPEALEGRPASDSVHNERSPDYSADTLSARRAGNSQPTVRSISSAKLDAKLIARGKRLGRKCRELAREEISRTDSAARWTESADFSFAALARDVAVRHGYLSRDTDAGIDDLVDGSDGLFDRYRSVFIRGVRQGLVSDDDND